MNILTEEEYNILKQSIDMRMKLIDEGILYEDSESGILYTSGLDNEYSVQSNWIDISIRQVKVFWWYLPIGYDIKINNTAFGYTFLAFSMCTRITKIVTDFKYLITASVNPKYINSANLAIRELAQGISEARAVVGGVLSSMYGLRVILTNIADAICEQKIPMWLFDAMGTAFDVLVGMLNFSWFKLILSVVQIMTPTISDSIKMVNGLIEHKNPILHYTLIVYNGFDFS